MAALFELENIRFGYGKAPPFIDGLSLCLESGRFYGVIGPNGSGKSTLVDLLMGHLQPASGTVFYKEKDLRQWSRAGLSREMALVPQNFYVNFPFTAGEVVMMGRYPHLSRFSPPRKEDVALVREVMNRTDTLSFSQRLVTELSGGERQRVVVARALAQQAAVLLLDEATASMDIYHAAVTMELAVQSVRETGATVVAVLHDINTAAAWCDRLILLEGGKVAAMGAVEAVLTEAPLKTVFQMEAKVYEEPFLGRRQVVFRRALS